MDIEEIKEGVAAIIGLIIIFGLIALISTFFVKTIFLFMGIYLTFLYILKITISVTLIMVLLFIISCI